MPRDIFVGNNTIFSTVKTREGLFNLHPINGLRLAFFIISDVDCIYFLKLMISIKPGEIVKRIRAVPAM